MISVDDSSGDDIDFSENVSALVAELKKSGGPRTIMSVTDIAMTMHASAKEELKSDEAFAGLTGASLKAVVLCNHKLLTRALVPGMDTLAYAPLSNKDEKIPLVPKVPAEDAVILKPVAAVGSAGVCKVHAGMKSPYKGQTALKGALHTATERFIRHFDASVPNAREAIGLLEEYVPSHVKKVSVDGAIVDGVVIPWMISDNVYCEDEPEVFEALESPSRRTTSTQQQQIWELFRKIASGLHNICEGSFNRQFICIEMFVFPCGRVEAMEVNIRISANQLPTFHRVLVNGCPFQAQRKMQEEVRPKLTTPKESGVFACTLYRPTIKSVGACHKRSEPEAIYYQRNETNAHVYGYGASPEAARRSAESLYDELVAIDFVNNVLSLQSERCVLSPSVSI